MRIRFGCELTYQLPAALLPGTTLELVDPVPHRLVPTGQGFHHLLSGIADLHANGIAHDRSQGIGHGVPGELHRPNHDSLRTRTPTIENIARIVGAFEGLACVGERSSRPRRLYRPGRIRCRTRSGTHRDRRP